MSVSLQGKEPTSVPLLISDWGGVGGAGSNNPKLTLSLSLQATCPPQLSPLHSVLSGHLCLSFHCPCRRQSSCPSGLALVWLPSTARPAMGEEGQNAKEMRCRGSNAGLLKHTIAPSSFLHLFLVGGPCLVLPSCPSFLPPDLRDWRSHADPLLLVASKGLHLAIIKTFFLT